MHCNFLLIIYIFSGQSEAIRATREVHLDVYVCVYICVCVCAYVSIYHADWPNPNPERLNPSTTVRLFRLPQLQLKLSGNSLNWSSVYLPRWQIAVKGSAIFPLTHSKRENATGTDTDVCGRLMHQASRCIYSIFNKICNFPTVLLCWKPTHTHTPLTDQAMTHSSKSSQSTKMAQQASLTNKCARFFLFISFSHYACVLCTYTNVSKQHQSFKQNVYTGNTQKSLSNFTTQYTQKSINSLTCQLL